MFYNHSHAHERYTMARKLRSDSATSQAQAFANADVDIQVPEGIEMTTPEEQTIWRQFSKTRSRDSWRAFDLVLLSKIVKLEASIRKHQIELDATGAIIENQRGTPIENPLFRVIDTLQRQQMAIIRSMSLNQTASDPRVLNETGKKEAAAKNVIKSFGVESLIAMPSKAQ